LAQSFPPMARHGQGRYQKHRAKIEFHRCPCYINSERSRLIGSKQNQQEHCPEDRSSQDACLPDAGERPQTHVDFAEQHRAKIHLIPVLLDGQQAHQLVAQHLAEEDQATLPLDVSDVADSTHGKAVSLGRLRYGGRVASRAGHVNRAGGGKGQRFMRAFFVETALELVKPILLFAHGKRRRRGRVSLQGAMHPFMPPILLRLSGINPFVNNT